MQLNEAVKVIESQMTIKPQIGMILGSGLGVLADELTDAVQIPYESIPHFPKPTVEGHKGQFVVGLLDQVPVIVMQGRFHYYEGYSLEQVTLPVRVMTSLGIKKLIVTNASGGVNTSFAAGDLMLITDHINMLGTNPLIGPNDNALGNRFPDMSAAYDPELQGLTKQAASDLEIKLKEGVYLATSGPSYETPAEVRMMRTLGADAVGMSTVPEVIVAKHSGLSVLGISCISNAASGILQQPLSHEEVMETTEKVKVHFIQLVKDIVKRIG
ncbi:purine-nucleoside phosphorylase [Scopulibacillus darangshiensis]|uniref:Purine nucleoside phosphorylase n=1 Tax=Scopulibacillus darangshiensis TaxID=442528 RepID=A0A4R2P9W4_9BACL|nr:purine-nucleoside phosphorylase [Scopulibacillus darangshiensis]TCP31732.1 purine-nucleoside phosphorylase [Scopulibacillus darangshiensis]